MIHRHSHRYTSCALDSIDSFLDTSIDNQKIIESCQKKKFLSDAYSDFTQEFSEYEEAREFEQKRISGHYSDEDLNAMFGLSDRSLDYLRKDPKAMAALGILDEYGWDIESIREYR